MVDMYKALKSARPFLTPQQYRTIKGQIIAGDEKAAMKGLQTLAKRILKEREE